MKDGQLNSFAYPLNLMHMVVRSQCRRQRRLKKTSSLFQINCTLVTLLSQFKVITTYWGKTNK